MFSRQVLALALLSATSGAALADVPTIRMCGGKSDGVYFFAAQKIAQRAASFLKVQVIETQGAMDNIQQINDGKCDAAPVQADALKTFSNTNASIIPKIDVADSLYQETVHLLCDRKANISSVKDLNKNTIVAIGDLGTGSSVTWDGFVRADKAIFGNVSTDPHGGIRALKAVAAGQASCMFSVAGIGTQTMKNDAAAMADKLVLIPIEDDKLQADKDTRGQPLYRPTELPKDVYGALMPSGTMWGHKPLKTVGVEAQLIVSTDWIRANDKTYDQFLRAVSAAAPDVRKRAVPVD